LTMASSEALVLSRRLMFFAVGSLPYGQGPEIPCFTLLVLLSVPSAVPRRIGWPSTVVLPSALAFAQSQGARHPLDPRNSRFTPGMGFEAAQFALCYGPESCWPGADTGRLHSSFHPMSHLSGTSNMTTRPNSQSP